MLFALLVACDWGSPTVTPLPPDPEPLPPLPESPLPPAPRRGVAEVATPPEIVRATAVQDVEAPGFVDVWFDADRLDFDALGARIDGWGLTRTDGDGASWRVAAPEGAEGLVPRLLAVPGIADARMSVTRGTLPSGRVREGSETYGAVTHRWSIGEGGPQEVVEGGTVPRAVLPSDLSAGARACLQPVAEDLELGVSAGPGWERALSTAPMAWALVLEDFGPCQARGHLLLTRDAPSTALSFGGRSAVEADEAFLQDLAVRWLGTRRSEFDPLVMSTVAWLSEAPDAVLARAVRDVAPSAVQGRLLEAFAARNPDGALALAGGSVSPVLRAAAIGQDEELRAATIHDPNAPASAVYAALAIWRPGPKDSPDTLGRFLQSRDPGVRARAWQARAESTEGLCNHQLGAATTADALADVYRDCPQMDVRGAAFERLRTTDAERALALLTSTLERPETEAAGIAAVARARALGRDDLLVALVERTHVSRGVRAFALTELEKAGHARVADLQAAHGDYLGTATPLDPGAATAMDEE